MEHPDTVSIDAVITAMYESARKGGAPVDVG